MREDYAKLVSELKKPGLLICEEMTPFKADLLHMAVGIMGEVVEYKFAPSDDDIVEELGDIYFFLEGIRQIIKVSDDQYYDIGPVSLIHDSAELLDLVKKFVFTTSLYHQFCRELQDCWPLLTYY